MEPDNESGTAQMNDHDLQYFEQHATVSQTQLRKIIRNIERMARYAELAKWCREHPINMALANTTQDCSGVLCGPIRRGFK